MMIIALALALNIHFGFSAAVVVVVVFLLFMSLFACMFSVSTKTYSNEMKQLKIFRTECKEENKSSEKNKNEKKNKIHKMREKKRICAQHTIKVPYRYTYLKKQGTQLRENKWRMELN